MAAYLQRWESGGPELVVLAGEQMSIGKGGSNDLAFDDETVSHLHAALVKYPSGWAVRDLSSRNGTFVNGERIWTERALRGGDEIRVGAVRLVYQDDRPSMTVTDVTTEPPELSRGERDVLVALCRPVLSGTVFTVPATVKGIADELCVSQSAVKQHLANLYDKFEVPEGTDRRPLLANAAIRSGAVTLIDLRREEP